MVTSCGIIPFRLNEGKIEFFVGHPGGNYYNQKNLWMFLKGAVEGDESWQSTAIREFKEETGLDIDIEDGELIPLGSVQQNPHKVAVAFGWQYSDINPDDCRSNYTETGIPEIDAYKWMDYDDICRYTHYMHIGFYDQLKDLVQEF